MVKKKTARAKFDEHAARVLEHFRLRYEAGNKAALLGALHWCLGMRVMVPDWVAAHINQALRRWESYETLTLDEALGIKRTTDPRKIAAERRAPKIIGELWMHIWSEIDAGASRNEEFFEKVGKKFGISKTRAKEYWRRGNGAFGTEPPEKKPKR